jgi:hypothetical protein
MSTQETTLDEMTLTEVLKEQVKDLKEIKEDNKKLKSKLEEKDQIIAENKKQTNDLIASFEDKYKKIIVTAPIPDTAPLYQITATAFMEFRLSAIKVLNDAFTKNRVFVLPEDGGMHFKKVLGRRFGIWAGVVLVAVFACWFGFRYMYLISENSRFRSAWYWKYIHEDDIGKQKMSEDINSFKQPSINKLKTETIEKFIKDHERELRIKALEDEADSLKSIANPGKHN